MHVLQPYKSCPKLSFAINKEGRNRKDCVHIIYYSLFILDTVMQVHMTLKFQQLHALIY